MTDHVRQVLQELRRELEAFYGDRLAGLVLYGSQARGDAHEESDVDVLLILHGDVHPAREVMRLADLRVRLNLKHDVYLSILPVSTTTYGAGDLAIIRNVHREGVTV